MRFAFALVLLVACGDRNPGGPDGGGEVDGGTDDADITADAPDQCVGGTLCGLQSACCPAGNECVLDQCVAACATGIYCGQDLGTCCASGQVCLEDACVNPGAACADPYDCEPGFFCEPSLNQCLPQPDPLTCQSQPTFGTLQPTLERFYDDYEVISIPIVANLDGVGGPEIVVNTARHDAGFDFDGGRIVILDGSSGNATTEMTVKVGPIPDDRTNALNPSYASHGRSTVAVGDVNGDNLPDIIYAARPATASSTQSVIVAIDHTGKKLWHSHLPGQTAEYTIQVENGAPTLANFDNDPDAEIVFGATLIDNDGAVIWDQGGGGAGGFVGTNAGYQGGISVIADLDGDTKPEIISGKNAWTVAWNNATPAMTTVTPKWTYTGNDGYPAVADLDANGTPEVVLVASNQVIVLNGQTGALWCAQATCTTPQLVQPRNIPVNATNNRGGPPTVADFDGDGRPEIGVAGGQSYSVYDLYRPTEDITGVTPAPTAGQTFVRWSRTTQDGSSNATGSSVFDFQGDGSAEVVYQDECHVWVYSGVDGTVQLQEPNTTGTIHEYPLVVDADGDGNSEILVVANLNNNSCPAASLRKGVYMYGDSLDRWVPTRKVWTQHAYHVTNATAAGNVPLAEDNNWMQPGLNDYRKNAQGEGVFNAPNLTVELAVGLDKCSTSMLSLRARVTNVGALGVLPGAVVEFRAANATGALLGMGVVTTPLLPGGSALVTLDVPTTSGTDFWAGVDGAPGAGSVAECDETDNQDATSGAACPTIF
jgi:hypothetical protein